MESLSGNQVKDLKELYASIYKSDDQDISETTAALQGLSKSNLEAMKGEKKEKINVEDEKKKPITINLPNGGTTKVYPDSPDYEKAKKGENFSIDAGGERGKIDVNKNDSGKVKGKMEIKSALGDSIEKIEKDTKDAIEKDKNPSGKVIPKPTKPLMKNSPAAKAGIPIETRQKFANQNAAFQATKNKDSGYNKMDFIKDFPKSQTAKKFNKGEPIPGFSYKKNLKNSYEPYDLVLDYVLSEGHADTVEEAHYVMMQMDEGTIQTIVEKEQGVFKSNVLNKKYPNQPKMTEKGKEILPNLPDPTINGKDYNKIFGIGSSSQKALELLKK